MKQFMLFTLVILFISCSSESDTENNVSNPQITQDPIIGTWNLAKENGFNVDSCTGQSTYVFNSDNTFTFTQFSSSNNQCYEDTQNSYRGEWTNNDDGTYYIKRHGYTSGTDAPISFENDNQDMKIGNYTWAKQ